MNIHAAIAGPSGVAGFAGLLAAALLAPSDGSAQERVSQAFECQGQNACRVRCIGLADIARVQRVVVEEAPWDAGTLMLTVMHEFGVATLLLRGDAGCRLDNLRATG